MGAYSRGTLICYFGREGGRLFGGGRLLERGRSFEEIRYSNHRTTIAKALIQKVNV